MRARKTEGNEAKAMPHMNQYGTSKIAKGSIKVELDGKGRTTELPSDNTRHEMSGGFEAH